MSDPWVVDTNVGVVANDRIEERPRPVHLQESIDACTRFLYELTSSGRIAVDDAWEIIREYQARMRSSGQPGPGDAFLKWVLVNQANPARCRRVDISGRLWTASGGSAALISTQPASTSTSSALRKSWPTANASMAQTSRARCALGTGTGVRLPAGRAYPGSKRRGRLLHGPLVAFRLSFQDHELDFEEVLQPLVQALAADA
jgi:hypothetical protein